jgi:hypothetical protein
LLLRALLLRALLTVAAVRSRRLLRLIRRTGATVGVTGRAIRALGRWCGLL